MNLQDGYLEEDLFPKLFTNYEERSYGILFYNEENRDSYDSNHAVIYMGKIDDLGNVLADIIHFYRSKNLRPIISLCRSCIEGLGQDGRFSMYMLNGAG